jgi:hypothetical protein
MNFINFKMKGNKFLKVNVAINLPERMRHSRATITGNFFTDQDLFPQQPNLQPF